MIDPRQQSVVVRQSGRLIVIGGDIEKVQANSARLVKELQGA